MNSDNDEGLKFKPSPGKAVRIVSDKGILVKVVNMNRSERRRRKIYNRKSG